MLDRKYADIAWEQAAALLAIDSPTGFTAKAAAWVKNAFEAMGYPVKMTKKGGVLADLGGEGQGLLLAAHTDTLGGMVAEVKSNGRLRLTALGGMNANNGETENVRVYTRDGRVYEGTLQLCNASIHVNGDFSTTQRSFDTTEVVLDENVNSAADTKALGIETGDMVCFDPRTRRTESGYLKSRFLDDKLSVGILLGFAAAKIFDRTCETQFTGLVTQVYSGLRWSFLCITAFAAAFGMAVCFVWPPLQEGIRAMTGWIAASGHAGIFLYGFLERLLIPTGLHHLIYMPFQFSALGGSMTVGSVTYTGAYMVTMAEYSYGLPLTDDVVWMYTGFTKTFGYLGIAAAFILTAKKERRKRTAAAILPLAVTASLASITEPVDFLFCFVSPVLWVLHAALAGGFMVLLNALQVRAFTSNLLGSLVFNLSAAPQQTHRVPLLYLLGVLEILTYAVVFSAIIRVFDLPTPGRAPERETAARQIDPEGIRRLLAALGGPGNICTVDNCFTRLRITVKDPDRLDTAALLAMPHKGLVQDGPYLQLVCGLQAAQVRRAVDRELEQCAVV